MLQLTFNPGLTLPRLKTLTKNLEWYNWRFAWQTINNTRSYKTSSKLIYLNFLCIVVDDWQKAISEFPCASVSKRVQVRNLSHENDLINDKPVGGTHFHMNGFALRLVLKYWEKWTRIWNCFITWFWGKKIKYFDGGWGQMNMNILIRRSSNESNSKIVVQSYDFFTVDISHTR